MKTALIALVLSFLPFMPVKASTSPSNTSEVCYGHFYYNVSHTYPRRPARVVTRDSNGYVNLRSEPHGSIQGGLPNGTMVIVYDTYNQHSLVVTDRCVGWVSNTYLR